MYLLFVDESGDTGDPAASPTRYYALSGLVVHELRWAAVLEHLVAFRRRMRKAFGLKLREELHASPMLTRPGELVRIKRNDRMTIIRAHLDAIAAAPDVSLVNVLVDKQGKAAGYPVFDKAWTVLLHRVHDTIGHRNFPGPANPDERVMVFPDGMPIPELDKLVRRVRAYHPVPHKPGTPHGAGYRPVPLSTIIEDPNYRDSARSFFVQAADTVAWALYQQVAPSAYARKMSAHNYFRRLDPVLCKKAGPRDPLGLGVVRL